MEPFGASDGSPEYPDLARIAATAARWWWALLLGAAIGAAIALAAGRSGGDTYQASTRLLVGSNGGDYSELRAAGQQAQTDADLATSEPVLAAARARLRTPATMGELRANVSASADDVTRLLTISAKADTAFAAADIANAVATQLRLRTRSATTGPSGQLQVIEQARIPGRPEAKSANALVIVSALAGLLAALAVVVVRDLSRRLIATEDELAATVPAPFLGSVGRRRAGLVGAATLLAEHREHVVVAGIHEDGAGAYSALALAAALAAGGSHVLVVDADTDVGAGKGSLSRWLRLDRRPGLTEALSAPASGRGAADLEALIVRQSARVAVLPRGRRELEHRADADRIERLLRRLGRQADIVVISAPAAGGLSGAVAWAQVADGVVLAVRRHHASRDEARQAVDVLQRSGAPVIGTLLVQRVSRRPGRPSAVPAVEEGAPRGADALAPRSAPDPVRQLGG